jgi:hypothetical protein
MCLLSALRQVLVSASELQWSIIATEFPFVSPFSLTISEPISTRSPLIKVAWMMQFFIQAGSCPDIGDSPTVWKESAPPRHRW